MGFLGEMVFKRKFGTKVSHAPGLGATIATQRTQLSGRLTKSTRTKGSRLAAKDKRRVARASRQQQRRQRKHK